MIAEREGRGREAVGRFARVGIQNSSHQPPAWFLLGYENRALECYFAETSFCFNLRNFKYGVRLRTPLCPIPETPDSSRFAGNQARTKDYAQEELAKKGETSEEQQEHRNLWGWCVKAHFDPASG